MSQSRDLQLLALCNRSVSSSIPKRLRNYQVNVQKHWPVIVTTRLCIIEKACIIELSVEVHRKALHFWSCKQLGHSQDQRLQDLTGPKKEGPIFSTMRARRAWLAASTVLATPLNCPS